MNTPKKPFPSLAEIEREVIAESREWGRKRLEERLQELANQPGGAFPPRAAQTSKTHPAQRTGKNKSKG
ncbi:MAG: hypothetical protein JWQ71_2356 [Pedosphaera sp.]|nr:hypothetical protein [Pedosphaera sp.]